MKVTQPAWRVITVGFAVFFFMLAMRSDVYEATSPHSIAHTLFGSGVLRFEHPVWLSVHFWLRKT